MGGKKKTKDNDVPTHIDTSTPQQQQASLHTTTPKAAAKTSTADAGPSMLNIIMLYLTLMGIGALGGYILFSTIFVRKCTTELSQTEQRHSLTHQEMKENLLTMEQEQKQCISESALKQQQALKELNERLEAQALVVEKNGLLVAENERLLAHNKRIQQETDTQATNMVELKTLIQNLQEQIVSMELETNERNEQNKQLMEQLKKQDERYNLVKKGLEQQIATKEDALELQHVKETRLLESLQKLHIYTQEQSYKFLQSTYGPGPHFVELQLRFPSNMGEGPSTIILEMAPADLMPHAVFSFLEFVSSGLYDGTFFTLGDVHVLLASDVQHLPKKIAAPLRKRFQQYSHLAGALAFQEFSTSFPHTTLTVGFAGKPTGGPSFYVSMVDNTASHGPDDNSPGEPCFAKVVQGLDALARIHTMDKVNQVHLKRPVEIARARIVTIDNNNNNNNEQDEQEF